MLDRFRKSLKPKKGTEPADTMPHASPRPGEACHACGRRMPAVTELPPSPPMTVSPPSSVGDDDYYFGDVKRQDGEAWSSLNKSNNNNNNNNHGGRNGYSSQSNYSGRNDYSSHSNYSGHNNYSSQPNNISSPAPKPEVPFGLQVRPPVRQGTWSSSIYSPQTPDGNTKDAGWYRRGSVTRAGHVRPMGTPITTVDEDSEYSFDLPQRTLSNYSQSFTPPSRVNSIGSSNDQSRQQTGAAPLRFPQGLAILAAQESRAADEDVSPSNMEASASLPPPPPPMPAGATPSPPPRWRSRTISSMFRRRDSTPSVKSWGRRSLQSLHG